MEHIERMKIELNELKEKIKKTDLFLMKEIDEPNKLNDSQKIMLGIQISYMIDYARILEERIKYDKELLLWQEKTK